MLRETPELTVPAIMEKLKLSDYGVRKNIKILKEYIERIGSNKTGYWKIIK